MERRKTQLWCTPRPPSAHMSHDGMTSITGKVLPACDIQATLPCAEATDFPREVDQRSACHGHWGLTKARGSAVNCRRVEVWGPKGKETNPSQPRKPSWPVRAQAAESPSLQDRRGPEQLCRRHQIRPLCAQRGGLGCGGGSSLFCSLLPFVIQGPWRALRVGVV